MNLTSTTMQLAASFLLQGALLLLIVSLALRHLFRTNHWGGAVLRMWGGLIAWSVFVSLVMPMAVTLITHDSRAFFIFPESPVVAAALLIGWIHSTVICSLAYLGRLLWLRILSRNVQNRSA